MAYDVGDTLPIAADVKDAAGALANAQTVALTITLPDLTTVTPTVTNPPASTGHYGYDYPTTQAGPHRVRWLFTFVGGLTTSHTEQYDVRPATPAYLISVADAKQQLGKTSTADDEELRVYVEAATVAVERHLDKAVVRRTVVERRDLGIPHPQAAPGILQAFTLATKPVISLTSIVAADAGLTWNTANMTVNDYGVVRVLAGSVVWGPVVITYQAGMTVVPAEYGLAARIIVQHIWQNTQRGQKGSPRPGLETPGAGFTSFGYSIPNAALELLGPPISGIA